MCAQISLASTSHVPTLKFKGAGKHNAPMTLEGEENQKNGKQNYLWYLEGLQVNHGARDQSQKGRGTVWCLLLATDLGSHPSLSPCASGIQVWMTDH